MEKKDAKETVKVSVFDSFESEVANYNKEEIIRSLILAGAKRINGCKIVAVAPVETEEGVVEGRFRLTLNRAVPGLDDEGNVVAYRAANFWFSDFIINLRDDDEYCILTAEAAQFSGKQCSMLMYGAEVDIIAEYVPEGEYKNPFKPNADAIIVDEPFIKLHIASVHAGQGAKLMLEGLRQSMVQSMF